MFHGFYLEFPVRNLEQKHIYNISAWFHNATNVETQQLNKNKGKWPFIRSTSAWQLH